MITLHHLRGEEFDLNCELIIFVETTPDTVIHLDDQTHTKIVVKESAAEVRELVREWKRSIGQRLEIIEHVRVEQPTEDGQQG